MSYELRKESDAQRRRRTTGRNGTGEREGSESNCLMGEYVAANVRRQRANARNNGNRTYRDGDADAERRDGDIRFGVIAVLERVIPLIKHLHHGGTNTNGQNRRDSESSESHLTAV